MLRLAGFFVVVLLAMQVLRLVPFVGGLFANSFVGFWLTAILVSAVASRWASRAVDRARIARRRRELGAVDTPHNQGKLVSLLLAGGYARAAVAPLERAIAGEPGSAEWRYRLGLALLATGRAGEAADAFARAVAIDEEHAYGAVQLRLAEALEKADRPSEAHDAVARFERNHGPSPESAYRRGRALRKLGRAPEAREAFREVGALAARSAGFQRGGARGWAARALLARVF